MATTESKHDNDVPGDASGSAPETVPDPADTGEGGKLKMIMQLLRKCFGVKDIAAMCVINPLSPTRKKMSDLYI
jgi:hypothetical protein